MNSPAAPAEEPLGASARARIALPFAIVTLIWSSTWLVIRGQIFDTPPGWSVTYRFVIACAAMMLVAWRSGAGLRLSPRQQLWAAAYGIAQYMLNYQAVYLAEQTVTSGLVAVLFALLIVPNALFAWIFYRQGVSRPFLLGSGVAMLGMVLLFAHEVARGAVASAAVWTGIGWSLAGVLFSSVANVMQANPRIRPLPVATLVAWGMFWGVLFDAAAAWAVEGPPVWPASWSYWAGTAYLGLIGSALAFSLYFRLIRLIGPARAAYSSVLTPVLAMALSTLFEGYRWSVEAAAGGVLAAAGLVVALTARRA